MKKVDLRNFFLHVSIRCFDLNLPEKVISDARICESGSLNLMQAGGNDAILKTSSSQSSLFGGENVGRILSTWNIDMNKGNGGESGQLWILLLLFDRLSNWKLL